MLSLYNILFQRYKSSPTKCFIGPVLLKLLCVPYVHFEIPHLSLGINPITCVLFRNALFDFPLSTMFRYCAFTDFDAIFSLDSTVTSGHGSVCSRSLQIYWDFRAQHMLCLSGQILCT